MNWITLISNTFFRQFFYITILMPKIFRLFINLVTFEKCPYSVLPKCLHFDGQWPWPKHCLKNSMKPCEINVNRPVTGIFLLLQKPSIYYTLITIRVAYVKTVRANSWLFYGTHNSRLQNFYRFRWRLYSTYRFIIILYTDRLSFCVEYYFRYYFVKALVVFFSKRNKSEQYSLFKVVK